MTQGFVEGATLPYTCPASDLSVVMEALGTARGPWPRNHRAFTYRGRRWVPDVVKGRMFSLLEAGTQLDLAKLRDRAEPWRRARRRGAQRRPRSRALRPSQ